ncbi:MAG: AMP-binding protein, partial [Burkholderiaceae bacterium]
MTAPIDFNTIHFIPLEQRVLGPVLRARAEIDADRTYMRFEGQSWTFGQTLDIARCLACAFKDAGFAKGERLGLFVPNLPGFIFCWYGANLIGGVTVPINPSYTQYLLEYVANDADVRGLVTTRELLPVVESLSPERLARLRFVLLLDGTESGRLGRNGPPLLSFPALAAGTAAGLPDPEIARTFRDEHSIMYTSGTTGPSKGAMVPNGHFF